MFDGQLLPAGFKYPAQFFDVLGQPALPDLDPWFLLAADQQLSLFWMRTLGGLYPGRSLVPFAKHGGSDDVACFDGADTTGSPRVYYVHAYASPGWEDRGEVASFEEWLRVTQQESQEFKADSG